MKLSYTLLILFFQYCAASAQSARQIIKYGTVLNAIENNPIQYIVVDLVEKTDLSEKKIRSVLTDSKGNFEIIIDTVSSATLFLIFRSFLYATHELRLPMNSEKAIGIIRLQPLEKTLTGVEVVSAQVRKTLDKLIYTVIPKDFAPNSKATDVLQRVPLVTLLDNELRVREKPNVMIFLDGRLITFTEMSSMPAESIKSVEVVTNPSSQYDGEFKGAIINIRSKKQQPDMTKGTADLSKGVANNWVLGNLYLSYKRKKFLIISSVTILDNVQKGKGTLNRESGIQKFNSNSNTGVNITQSNASVTGYYDIDSSKQLSSRLSYGNITDKGYSNGLYQITNGATDSTYTFLSNNLRSIQNYAGDIEYKKTYKDKGILSLSTKYFYKTIDRRFDLQNNYSIPQAIRDWNKTNDKIVLSDAALNVLRIMPIKKNNSSLEYGFNFYIRKYNSSTKYQQYDSNAKVFYPAPGSPYITDLKQNILAVFSTYRFTKKAASFAFGSRIEYVNETFPLFKNNYIKILPNISAGYSFKENRYLEFTFSQKLRRPSLSQLNPTIFSTEPGTVYQGSLFLDPENYYNWSLSYNKVYKSRSNLNVSLYYEFDVDIIIDNTISSSNSNIIRKYQNIGRQHIAGASFSFTKKIFKTISLNFNSFAEYDKLVSPANNTSVFNDVYIYSFSLNVSLTLLKKYSLSGFFSYTNKIFDLYSETSLPALMNISVRRSFFNNKISASLRGMLFTNSNKRIRLYNDYTVSQTSSYYRNNNNVIFRIEYNFGKTFNDSKRRNIREANDIKSD
jgi:outer membrane receptor protein involved in Fe transport